jgi:hypothetical protein
MAEGQPIMPQITKAMSDRRYLGIASVVLAIVFFTGCSDQRASAVAERNASNIQRLTNMYTAFQAGRFGVGPKDEAELKTFLKAESPDRLRMMGVDPGNLDAVFTSDRDHKPFKVRYGLNRGATSPIVFEQEGVGGKKDVCFSGGTVEEVDANRYNELWDGKAAARPLTEGAPQNSPANASKK